MMLYILLSFSLEIKISIVFMVGQKILVDCFISLTLEIVYNIVLSGDTVLSTSVNFDCIL